MASLLVCRTLQQMVTSSGVFIVNALCEWTDTYFGIMQGICIACLVFAITTQLDHTSIQPRLMKRICLLYCNRQTRKLLAYHDGSTISLFSDLLLAMMLAILTAVLYEGKDQASTRDLHQMIDSLFFLYSSMLDFAFKYGRLKVTICAFGASMFLKRIKPPEGKIAMFCWKLASIISANLLSQGMMSLMPSTRDLQLLQAIASLCILRLILPQMQSYLSYFAAQRILQFQPDLAPIFFCVIIWIELMPVSSREWVKDTCVTYLLLSLSILLAKTTFWGMVFMLILTHYLDFLVTYGHV